MEDGRADRPGEDRRGGAGAEALGPPGLPHVPLFGRPIRRGQLDDSAGKQIVADLSSRDEMHVLVAQRAAEKGHQRLDDVIELVDAALTADAMGNNDAAANHDVLPERSDGADEAQALGTPPPRLRWQ